MPNNKPEALPKEPLGEALRRAGSGTAGMDRLLADWEAGAPVNPDGTMSIFAYTAWILKEMSDDD